MIPARTGEMMVLFQEIIATDKVEKQPGTNFASAKW
jgi:hypothetical protein